MAALPTKEELKELKEKYGDLTKITAKESGRVVIVKEPNLKEYDRALVAGSNGGLGFNKTIYNECVVWASEGINEDDKKAFYSKISSVVKIHEATVEKL